MITPAWINAVAGEGSINEITHYIVDLHRQLHNRRVDSRPPEHTFTTRQHYIDELVRLWKMLREAENRIDVC
jgi:hypothetical protein